MTLFSVNGELIDSQVACISPQDRGFRFGDGVFETIPVYQSVPYLLEYHIERLARGLHCLSIQYYLEKVQTDALRLIEATQTQDAYLRIAISRGVGSRGYLPTGAKPTIIIEVMPLSTHSGKALNLVLSEYEKISSRALPTDCKLAQGLGSTLARLEAEREGYDEALQCDALGNIAEASSANIFWLSGGTLYTPSLSTGALAGVTRRWLMENAPFPVQEGLFPLAVLKDAQAVLLTNATQGIMPVQSLQPEGWQWQSETLSETLNSERQSHIAQYITKFKQTSICSLA